MNIDKFIQDGQDAKVVEKIHAKIVDMLTAGEFIQYISLQKKPAVTLLPDSITVSNKRIFLCEFAKLGLTTNFEIFSWGEIKDIAFKEEIFGSKVTVIPVGGENLTIDYIPKVQARKLYQLIKTALENPSGISTEEPISPHKPERPTAATETILDAPAEEKPVEPVSLAPEPYVDENAVEQNGGEADVEPQTIESPAQPEPATPTVSEEDDELTQKLKKLKSLYDRQLITQAEYESKKSELLSQL